MLQPESQRDVVQLMRRLQKLQSRKRGRREFAYYLLLRKNHSFLIQSFQHSKAFKFVMKPIMESSCGICPLKKVLKHHASRNVQSILVSMKKDTCFITRISAHLMPSMFLFWKRLLRTMEYRLEQSEQRPEIRLRMLQHQLPHMHCSVMGIM